MFRSIILVFLISTTFVGVFGARLCYLCNSYSDKDHAACIDPMSPYPQVNQTTCPDNYVCTRVSYITQKQLVVSRGCDPSGDTCNNIYNSLVSYYPDVAAFNCYFCSIDYCNGASGLEKPSKEFESLLETVS